MRVNHVHKTLQTVAIWVINLDSATRRLNAIAKNLHENKLSFQRIPAVNTNTFDIDIEAGEYNTILNKKNYFVALTSGEKGCFMSHRVAWQKLLNSEHQFGIILEDDVELDPNAADNLLKALTWLDTEEPRYLKLYAKRRQGGKIIQALDGTSSIRVPKLPPLGTQAQAINRAAAERLLACSNTFGSPVDVFLQTWWIHKVQVAVVQPNSFHEISTRLGGSTIQSSLKGGLMKKIFRSFIRLKFRTKLFLLAFYFT
jgi:GR25 family glycosyltransferase involved in LPS biosynthesis